ncbi:hypothetical protein ACWATR_09480 [Nostoc sp. UIC 10890]
MMNHGFDKLITFLNQLEQETISYTLVHRRDETIMVNVAVAGERWEVEFFEDGSVEVERFVSSGEINGEEAFSELFAMYSELENHSSKHTQNAKLTSTT